MSEHYELKNSNLKSLIKAFEKIPSVKVGVLASSGKMGRQSQSSDSNKEIKDPPTNAQIAMRHEYGEDGLPIRSALRVPIAEYLEKYLIEAGAFDKEALKEIVDEKSLLNWMKKVGITAERVVQDAFDSGGFGKWKPSIMAFKNNHQTLVETQQYRNSISSEVVEE